MAKRASSSSHQVQLLRQRLRLNRRQQNKRKSRRYQEIGRAESFITLVQFQCFERRTEEGIFSQQTGQLERKKRTKVTQSRGGAGGDGSFSNLTKVVDQSHLNSVSPTSRSHVKETSKGRPKSEDEIKYYTSTLKLNSGNTEIHLHLHAPVCS